MSANAEPIDLRSDTVTKPDAAMRRAMAEAEVGDDVLGDDPTVRALEEAAAEAMGTGAALFVPSGTMGNQIALRLLARPGSEVLCDANAHVMLFELGATAALSGIQSRPLISEDGLPSPETFRSAIVPRSDSRVPTGAVTIENTHNVGGGRVFSRDRIERVLAVAREHGLPVHLDGARIWNAAVALGTTPARLADGFDTVMFCLSKGLGAPVGSLLCGAEDLVAAARIARRMFGGAMRQAGVLAAAGLLALRDGPKRLAEDHENARRLAEAVAHLPRVILDPATVQSNIVIFRVTAGADGAEDADEATAEAWIARAKQAGVLADHIVPGAVRLVTHRDAPRPAIDEAIRRLRRAFAE